MADSKRRRASSRRLAEQSKRDDVLRATVAIVARQGIAASPMSAIAREAGVGSGTIYNYFDSKEALIEELFRTLFAELCARMFAGADPTGDAEACFVRIWRNLVEWGRAEGQKLDFIEQCSNAPALQPTLTEAYRAHFEPLFAFLQRAVDAGVLRALPPDALIAVGIEPAITLVKRERKGFSFDDHVYDQACEACWAGILRPGSER